MSKRHASNSLLARRYGAALFELAKGKNAVDTVFAELSGLAQAAATPAAKAAFSSPLISTANQQKLVQDVSAAATFSELTRKFLAVLAENRRLWLIGDIALAFAALTRAHKGEAEVEVTTAQPLTDQKKAEIIASLQAATKHTITLREKQDASLIGGLKIHMGSKLLDLSVKGRLERLISAQKRAA